MDHNCFFDSDSVSISVLSSNWDPDFDPNSDAESVLISGQIIIFSVFSLPNCSNSSAAAPWRRGSGATDGSADWWRDAFWIRIVGDGVALHRGATVHPQFFFPIETFGVFQILINFRSESKAGWW